jgi:hypothetical protein
VPAAQAISLISVRGSRPCLSRSLARICTNVRMTQGDWACVVDKDPVRERHNVLRPNQPMILRNSIWPEAALLARYAPRHCMAMLVVIPRGLATALSETAGISLAGLFCSPSSSRHGDRRHRAAAVGRHDTQQRRTTVDGQERLLPSLEYPKRSKHCRTASKPGSKRRSRAIRGTVAVHRFGPHSCPSPRNLDSGRGPERRRTEAGKPHLGAHPARDYG